MYIQIRRKIIRGLGSFRNTHWKEHDYFAPAKNHQCKVTEILFTNIAMFENEKQIARELF